jgi:DeoR family suf operon transcriptional repressor
MHSLHDNQKKILEYLLSHPDGATLEELSAHLGITKTAAKEHVLKVLHLGLLTFTDLKGSVGRPKRRYLLSSEGHESFPKQYSWLSNVLLELLAEDLGEKTVARLMADLGKKVAGSMKPRFEKARSTAELLALVTEALNELGYRAMLKQSDVRKGAVVEATHCVYHSVAKEHPALCGFDISFLEKSSGMSVQMESCIAKGGAVCRFCLKTKKD